MTTTIHTNHNTNRNNAGSTSGSSISSPAKDITGHIILDWSGRDGEWPAPVRDLAPCKYCGKPAMLRHPQTNEPCHKVCAELAINNATTNGVRLSTRVGGGR
jgi:hypothetical protein